MLLELGQIPLIILALEDAIKHWVRIITKTECNENTNIKQKLTVIGMREQFLANDKNSHLKAFQRTINIFHQEAFSDIQRSDSKLRTYSLLKVQLGFENYLNDIKSIKERTALTKLRLSNHSLMIKKRRHRNLDRNLRFVRFAQMLFKTKYLLLFRKCSKYFSLVYLLSLFYQLYLLIPVSLFTI